MTSTQIYLNCDATKSATKERKWGISVRLEWVVRRERGVSDERAALRVAIWKKTPATNLPNKFSAAEIEFFSVFGNLRLASEARRRRLSAES